MWFIRHSNGLFHYGLDYAEALGSAVREIWVRTAALERAVRLRLPHAAVRVLSTSALVAELLRVRSRHDFLFTPSSHPLPLVSRQMVVVHDSFPFTGRMGAIKRAMFRAGLASSGGIAAYINRCDAYRFLDRCGLPEGRLEYMPNRLAEPVSAPAKAPALIGRDVTIGLFGTDSPKKNYAALFAAFAALQSKVSVTWHIYGHANAYTRDLCETFPELSIEVIGSDKQSMEAFVQSIDIAVSVATGEGFARPVALALMTGVPTLLIDTPVFREFYGSSVSLIPTVEVIAATIAGLRPGDRLDRPALAGEAVMRADFDRSVAWLASR